ncbi:tripartite tricarboxylate transporter substrate binding protein [Pollutimonas bauzanensis]|uniref:Bug family tripartite tricarboxylate transporter substrate binding protein n=1 Tax=Pollutimonas bauzanensis TaxID=658167 RepID=UPI00333FB4A1
MKKTAFLFMTAALISGAAMAQAYPVKPIRLVVPLAPGGTTDLIARMVAERMSPILGQPVVIENRGGAGGTIASNHVAKSEPDGYTLLMGTIGTAAIAPAMYASLPYDPEKDFEAVSLLTTGQFVLAVNPSVPAKTLGEFLSLAREKPGTLSYGSAGNGSTLHLGMELLKQNAGINIVHVPYRGSGPMVVALVGGEIQAGLPDIPSALPFIESGKLRPLAVTSADRSTILPDIPTLAESGFKDYSVTVWLGIYAPAGTPRAIVDKLNESIALAVQDENLKMRLAKIDSSIATSTPDEFAEFSRNERAKWKAIVDTSGSRIE